MSTVNNIAEQLEEYTKLDVYTRFMEKIEDQLKLHVDTLKLTATLEELDKRESDLFALIHRNEKKFSKKSECLQ